MPQSDGLSTAIEFLEKKQGPEVMIRAVEDAFSKHVCINWTLEIDWQYHDNQSFADLIEFFDPKFDADIISDRADELESLFRKLFFA